MKYIAIAALLLVACVPKPTEAETLQRAKNALTVEEYRLRLLECKAQGKDAGSLAVFERCAREADIQYGLDGPSDGGASSGVP